ncbi:MAG TPA: helix-turn-helix domain-containing protein [Xanthobacteraceae bacterium]|nr:helix-turn-helix domain-containing protein [Xanthobacteraceae bacterium]
MEFSSAKSIGELIKDKNIILKGADAATAMGFTQVPNFLLKSRKLSSGDKMAFAMLLSYAWQNDFCFPGQERLAHDMGLTGRSVRTHLKSLEANGLLTIQQRGQGKTNIYELNLTPKSSRISHADRKKTSALDRKKPSALDR